MTVVVVLIASRSHHFAARGRLSMIRITKEEKIMSPTSQFWHRELVFPK